MRRVHIEKLCDPCFDDGATTEGTVSVALIVRPGTSQLKTLDLCDKHHEALIAPVLALLESHGADPDDNGDTAADSGKWTCPQCHRDLASRKVAISHLARKHGIAEVPASQMVPPRNVDTAISCPLCNYLADGAYGLQAHRRHNHQGEAWPLEAGTAAEQRSGVPQLDLTSQLDLAVHGITCPECQEVQPTPNAFKAHAVAAHNASHRALTHPGETMTCDQCGYRATKPQGLASHIRKTHGG